MEESRLRRSPLARALLLGTSLCALGWLGAGCEVLPELLPELRPELRPGLGPATGPEPGPEPVIAPRPAGVLRVGVQTSDLPSRIDEGFACVEQAFEGALVLHGHDLSVEIEPFAVYKELLAALAEGRVDVARLEAGSYLTARQNQHDISMLAIERPGRGGPRQGMIVTAAGSPLEGLAGLRGKSFAFGDEHASLGRHLPQAALLSAGLRVSDLRHTAHLRGWEKVAAAVRLGEFDAGVLEASAYRRLNTDGGLRVLAPLIDAPRPWVARVGLERGVATALGDALLGIEDARCLQRLDASALDRPDENVFERVRAAMDASARLGSRSRAQSPGKPALPRR